MESGPVHFPVGERNATGSVITFFLPWRFVIRLGQAAREASRVMPENLRRTDYAFLKKGK